MANSAGDNFRSKSSDDIYAVLWSGGKDSCLALWRALKSGLHIEGLVNFFDDASDRVRFHGVRSTLIAEQARALNLELFQVGTKPDSFAASFEATLHTIKARGYSDMHQKISACMSHWQFLPRHDVSTDERKPDHDCQT
jgi:hypothetical protein